jgi:hypothetical protein
MSVSIYNLKKIIKKAKKTINEYLKLHTRHAQQRAWVGTFKDEEQHRD